MHIRSLAVALAALLLVPFVPMAQATGSTIVASNFQWTQADLEIQPGDSVTFVNGTTTPHSWVRDDGQDSCNLPCSRTFSQVATIPYHCGIHPSMRGTLQVGSVLSIAITSPAAGASVSGNVSVTGSATHLTADVRNVSVRFGNGPSVEADLLTSGMDVTWSATLDSSALIDGPQELVARATGADGAIKETRRNVVVDNPDRIDLQVTLVSAPTGSTGRTNVISFTMRNEGNVATPNVVMRAQYFYQGEWHHAAEAGVLGVAAQGTRSGTLTWAPSGVLVGRFDIRVIADPYEDIVDVDRSNNVRNGSAGWITSAIAGLDLTDPV